MKTLLIWLLPTRITIIIFIILWLLHWYSIYKFRQRNTVKKYSWLSLIGGIAVPYFIMYVYLETNQFIEKTYGEIANSEHSYYIFMLYYLPFLIGFYFVFSILFDYVIRIKKI